MKDKIEIAWDKILSGDFTNCYIDEISKIVNKNVPKKDFTDNDCCFYAYGTSEKPTNFKYCPYCGQELDRGNK